MRPLILDDVAYLDRTTDNRDPQEQIRGLQAQLDAARRLIAELEAKLGERPAGEAEAMR